MTDEKHITYLILGKHGIETVGFARYFLKVDSTSRVVVLDSRLAADAAVGFQESRVLLKDVDREDGRAFEDLLSEIAPDYIINVPCGSIGEVDACGEEGFLHQNIETLGLILQATERYCAATPASSGFQGFLQISVAANPWCSPVLFKASVSASEIMVKEFADAKGFPAGILRAPALFGPYQGAKGLFADCIDGVFDSASPAIALEGEREWLYVSDFCRLAHRMLLNLASGSVCAAKGYGVTRDSDFHNMVSRISEMVLASMKEGGESNLSPVEPDMTNEVGLEDGLAYTIAWEIEQRLNGRENNAEDSFEEKAPALGKHSRAAVAGRNS